MIKIEDIPYLEELETEKAIETLGSSGGSFSLFGIVNGENGFLDAIANLFVSDSLSSSDANIVGYASDPDGASVVVGAEGTSSGDNSYAFASGTSFASGTTAYASTTIFTSA